MMKALILAGGRGSRLDGFTKNKNKSMIRLFEKPLIEYNLDQVVETGVREIIIVVGYKSEDIIKYVGKEYRGIKVTYVLQKEQRGVVHAIECARKQIGDSDFIMVMADEIVIDAKMKNMTDLFKKKDLFTVCGINFERDKESISKTYTAMVNANGRAFRLIEKPKVPFGNIKGTGHCVFKNEILDCIERTPINANRGEKELVDMIQTAIDEGEAVYLYPLTEGYVNINNKADFDLAKKLIKESNPKVLIVHTQMKYFGGAELLIVELCNWLTKRGIKNDILALSKSKDVEKELINTKIIIPKHDIDLRPPGFKSTQDILKFVRLYRRELRKLMKEYDVINFHNFPVTWTLWPRKKPCVWMLNEPPNLWSKPNAGFGLKMMNKVRNYLDREIVKGSVDIICVADDFNQKRAKERYQKNSRIFYYGVNYDFFSKGNGKKAIEKFSLKDRFVVVQSGMLTEAKNQLESVKTIERVKEKIPNILLVLAGTADEDYKKRIVNYIEKNKLEKHVLFTGNVERNDLRDIYKASDVGLFPVGAQGGWLAPFELLCASKPIIVSKKLGAASVIEKYDLGILTENYAEALLEVFNNKEIYKKKSKKSSAFVKKNLGWNVFTDKMIKAYMDAWKTK